MTVYFSFGPRKHKQTRSKLPWIGIALVHARRLILINVPFFNANQEQSVIEHRVAFEAKYLGLPTPEGRMKAEKFLNITDRLAKRCSAWDERNLLSAGKDTLIKSVAQALPVYIMSIFVLPGKIHEALTRMIRRFCPTRFSKENQVLPICMSGSSFIHIVPS
jgi:hypothetical protein